MMEAIGVACVFGLFAMFMFAIVYSGIRDEQKGRRSDKVKARILLLSDSREEIEKYLVDKESIIGTELTDQLLSRLAEIKADKIIDKDWVTDIKHGTLPPLPEDQIVEVKQTEKA